MRGATNFMIVIAAVVVIIIASASMFTVQQTEQALVLRFGDPVAGRGLVTDPGLHFKIPFIENVVLLDKRILDVETPTQEVLASDNTRVEVDAFLRYRIVDPLKFYQSVGTIERADSQLGFILNSAVRRVLGEADLTQIVSGEREVLMGRIRDQVNQEIRQTRCCCRRCADQTRRSAEADFRESLQPACRANGRARQPCIAPRAANKDRRSPPRRIATSSYCGPTRNAKRTRSAARAMRSATASSPKPMARIRISLPSIARCRPMRTGSSLATRVSCCRRNPPSSAISRHRHLQPNRHPWLNRHLRLKRYPRISRRPRLSQRSDSARLEGLEQRMLRF